MVKSLFAPGASNRELAAIRRHDREKFPAVGL
jgi:hypothetical protein